VADKLDEVFRRYTDAVRLRLQDRGKRQARQGLLRLLANRGMELRAFADELENEAEFHQLVLETYSSFSGSAPDESRLEWGWQQAVKNFFRRSGYYVDVYDGKIANVDATFRSYLDAFQRSEVRTTYLALMEFVQFHGQSMDFETFQIRRFAADELEVICRNRVNEVFYPWATIDVKKSQAYWFIYFTEQSARSPVDLLDTPIEDPREFYLIRRRYTHYPKTLELILQQLALFDWQLVWSEEPSVENELEKEWGRFWIPFVFRVDDNLLGSPEVAPDLSGLAIDWATNARGEEIEVPGIGIILDEPATEAFKAFIRRAGDLLRCLRVKQKGWEFLEVALAYFIKAFFTAEGFEQMLWHITTLEALLGEKGEGLTERLARRIASILGRSENERKDIRKQFKELYDFRSDLVHGSSFQKLVYVGHLRNARNLARRTLFWFLHYLHYIQARFSSSQLTKGVPTREEILALIDLDPHSRLRLGQLIDNLPPEFPHVSEWMEISKGTVAS